MISVTHDNEESVGCGARAGNLGWAFASFSHVITYAGAGIGGLADKNPFIQG